MRVEAEQKKNDLKLQFTVSKAKRKKCILNEDQFANDGRQ